MLMIPLERSRIHRVPRQDLLGRVLRGLRPVRNLEGQTFAQIDFPNQHIAVITRTCKITRQ